jgi:hypothetical protein
VDDVACSGVVELPSGKGRDHRRGVRWSPFKGSIISIRLSYLKPMDNARTGASEVTPGGNSVVWWECGLDTAAGESPSQCVIGGEDVPRDINPHTIRAQCELAQSGGIRNRSGLVPTKPARDAAESHTSLA